jgi:catechol 2,3-dioxygenase-like lactoylglutathione lyase family enzyme
MKMIKTIPALPVQNIKESIEFYTTKLGFTAVHSAEGFAIVVRDEAEIHLWAASDETWKSNPNLFNRPIISGAESFIAGTASCRIQVNDIDQLFEEYKRQGVLHKVSTAIKLEPWGNREFHALDNHCNLLSFFEEV